MTEMNFDKEAHFGGHTLTYWKSPPKPPPSAVRRPPSHMFKNLPLRCDPPYSPHFYPLLYSHNGLHLDYPETSVQHYPFTDAVHSYIHDQELGMATTCTGYEGERRRMAQVPQVTAETLLTALSSEQSSQMMTDSLIHEEVTRAAKTLFSKRNRTLLHWLNPDVSKNQLKIDVNSAWASLPAAEKVFYISQVLGKFAPHTTSLMVNPQLEPSKKDRVCVRAITTENTDMYDRNNISTDPGNPLDIVRVEQETSEPKVKKARVKSKQERKPPKRKVEYSSDDEASCDSGLVMDIESKQASELRSEAETPKLKRKYIKRKQKASVEKSESEHPCPLPINNSDIKVEPNTQAIPNTGIVTRVKRKYVKRKLVRKKYKKREPKNKVMIETPIEMGDSSQQVSQPTQDGCDDMDVWVELEKDTELSKGVEEFKLLSEEVDSFWDSIGDPSSLFHELDIG